MDISTSTISVSGRDFLYACRFAIEEKEAEVKAVLAPWSAYIEQWLEDKDRKRAAEIEKHNDEYQAALDREARNYVKQETFWSKGVSLEEARVLVESTEEWRKKKALHGLGPSLRSSYTPEYIPTGPSINPLMKEAIKFRDSADTFPDAIYDIPVEVVAFISTGNAVIHKGAYPKVSQND